MYMGELGQSVGERFMLYAEKGRSVNCPAGTTQESSGRMGTGQQYVKCYRPPVFAPPPTTTYTYAPVTTTTVPTAVTTAISPQISPVLAQQQASPGATVAASPVSAPGPTTGMPSGISERQLRDILSAQKAAVDAERAFEERKRATELETLRRQMSERSRVQDEIYLASQKAEADRVAADRFAREQAEAAAQESAGAIPPPPSTMYAPTGGGAFPLPAQPLPSPDMTMAPQARDVTITQDGDGETPWALILLAAAGIGAVVLVGAKKGKRKKVSK
jgi:hypothetical protein